MVIYYFCYFYFKLAVPITLIIFKAGLIEIWLKSQILQVSQHNFLVFFFELWLHWLNSLSFSSRFSSKNELPLAFLQFQDPNWISILLLWGCCLKNLAHWRSMLASYLCNQQKTASNKGVFFCLLSTKLTDRDYNQVMVTQKTSSGLKSWSPKA